MILTPIWHVKVLGPQNDIVKHMQALPHKDVAAAVETVRASRSAQPAVKLAFEFLVLTAARSGEVRLATSTRPAEISAAQAPDALPDGRPRVDDLG